MRSMPRRVAARRLWGAAHSSRRGQKPHSRPKNSRAALQVAQMFGGGFRSVRTRVSIRSGAMGTHTDSRPALRLVQPAVGSPVEFTWFCGHCAAPAQGDQPPAPIARVCRSCGLGLLLETREDIGPDPPRRVSGVDSSLLVQALSWRAETLLGVSEDSAVNRAVVRAARTRRCGGRPPSAVRRRSRRGRRRRRRARERIRSPLEHLRRAAPGADRVRADRRARRWSCSRAGGSPAARRQASRCSSTPPAAALPARRNATSAWRQHAPSRPRAARSRAAR